MTTAKTKLRPHLIWQIRDLALPQPDPAAKLLLLTYGTRTDKDHRFHPSVARTARDTGLSMRTIHRKNRLLQSWNLLQWDTGHGTKGSRRNIANRYVLRVDVIQEMLASQTCPDVTMERHDDSKDLSACQNCSDRLTPGMCQSDSKVVPQCHPKQNREANQWKYPSEVSREANHTKQATPEGKPEELSQEGSPVFCSGSPEEELPQRGSPVFRSGSAESDAGGGVAPSPSPAPPASREPKTDVLQNATSS